MSKPIQLPERETRFLTGQVEIRAAAETEKPRVRGYAAKFNKESEELVGEYRGKRVRFVEIIETGAFDDVLNDDVRALFNHDPNQILARSKNGNGTLKMGIDSVGLYYEFEAPDTQIGRDLRENVRLGNVDQSSFSFETASDKWEKRSEDSEETVLRRTIKKVARLFDVSPVTYPAYPEATVALRSIGNIEIENNMNKRGKYANGAEHYTDNYYYYGYDKTMTGPIAYAQSMLSSLASWLMNSLEYLRDQPESGLAGFAQTHVDQVAAQITELTEWLKTNGKDANTEQMTEAERALENFNKEFRGKNNHETNSLSHWQRRMGLIDKTAAQ